MIEKLKAGLKQFDIELDEKTLLKIIRYKELLLEKNKTVNLTAITADDEVIEKHFIDSLYLYRYIRDEKGKKAIDVGTGAGFPGMVLAIAKPEIQFTLIDSIGKKTKFLEEVKEVLGLENVEVINMRSEDFVKKAGVREAYDFGFARAVAELRILAEYVIPFVKTGGVFYSQKADYKPEVENGKKALEILGAEIVSADEFKLPFSGDSRAVLTIKKIGNTDIKYPRRAGIPEKRPL